MRHRLSVHLTFLLSVAGLLLAWGSVGSPKTVVLVVDGAATTLSTHQTRIDSLLREAGVSAAAGDSLQPGPSASVADGSVVKLRRAVPVVLAHGDDPRAFSTTAATVGEVLSEAGVLLGSYDHVLVAGRPVTADAPLPRVGGVVVRNLVSAAAPRSGIAAEAVSINVRAVMSVAVHDGTVRWPVQVAASTVGAALREAGIGLLQGDVTTPPVNEALTAGQHVFIKRATPIAITADGRTLEVRTQGATVEAALAEQHIPVTDADRVEPALTARIVRGAAIQVVRLKEVATAVEEPIAYHTEYVADAGMEIGTSKAVQAGANGRLKRNLRLFYEDGREVKRLQTSEEVVQPPATHEMHYGTKVIYRTLNTPSGPVQYWKTMRVWATWYSPANAGKPASAPGYGITALGYEARRGIMAVDPRVIPLRTTVYVPGYGAAFAADTGGGVRGNLIDLAYGDDEEQDWVGHYVDIYFMAPGPDPSEIRPPIA